MLPARRARTPLPGPLHLLLPLPGGQPPAGILLTTWGELTSAECCPLLTPVTPVRALSQHTPGQAPRSCQAVVPSPWCGVQP